MEREVHTTIESMAFKGYGVARVNGKVVFVPYALKGEEARVEIVDEKKDYCFGRLNHIISPSPSRVTPPCPYFGHCGGCQWQHIDHRAQAGFKKEILEETIQRLGRLHTIPPIALIPSPLAYGYRVRVQLKGQQGRVGYYQERSHRIIPVDHCSIAHPLINQIIPCLSEALPFFSHMEEIEINVSPEEGRGILILHPFLSPPGMERDLTDFLENHPLLRGIAVARKGKSSRFGLPDLNVTVSFQRKGQTENMKLRISPESFFQVHLEQNQRLIQTVIELGDVKQGEKVLDLYAGIGNFTLPLASCTQDVTGIEENRTAVKDARNNALANEIEGCRFIHGKVEDVLRSTPMGKPDMILLDPPRTGCKSIIQQIADLKPERIVYVSCEPTTFSRDLRLFSDRGYRLEKLTLVDLFPQTYHMEVVGLLRSGC